MVVLGIGLQHDAGAAISVDGRVVSAVNEERLNRKKLYWGFPERAIPEVLRLADLSANDIDVVAVANTTNSTAAAGLENYYAKDLKRRALIQLSRLGIARLIGGTQLGIEAYRRLNDKRFHIATTRDFETQLRNWDVSAPIIYVDHHKSHLASAYYTSGWDTCLNISLDGVGDGYCSRIAVCRNGNMQEIHRVPFYHTPGQYYGFVTAWAGFTPGKHEGKITGLAAYGDPTKAIDILKSRISYSEKRFSFVNHGMWGWAEYEYLCKQFEGLDRADVAAAVQVHIEDIISQYVRQAVQKTGQSHIALSGGLFANVKLNQRVRDIEGVEDVFIHPHMGDGGLGVGAALAYQAEHTGISSQRLPNVYLGTSATDAEIETELRLQGFSYTRYDRVEEEIARHLAQGHVVARVNGRMEYGPRALGNRSILYQATDTTVNQWLNKRLNRTEFMPFAPAILKERAADYYIGYPCSDYASEFMTITYDVTDRCKREAPAVVHVDDTARPQVVSEDTNVSFYRILKAYERLTGFPQVINTSFNMHEEPIVCTVSDAIRAFQEGHLDVLAIGACIVVHPDLRKQSREAQTVVEKT